MCLVTVVGLDDRGLDVGGVVACFVVSHCVALQCEIAIQSSAAAVPIVMRSILALVSCCESVLYLIRLPVVNPSRSRQATKR
jgi:hypothetical protein